MSRNQRCRSCPLRGTCVYTRLFHTLLPGPAPATLGGNRSAPRPFVIEPATATRTFAPGASLRFDMVLLGRAVEWLPMVHLSVDRMASVGLSVRRHPFRLVRTSCQRRDGTWEPLIPSGPGGTVPIPEPRRLEPRGPQEADGLPRDRLTLRFRTPLRLERAGTVRCELDLRHLASKMLRRHLALAYHHAGAGPEWLEHDWEPLLDSVGEIRVEENRLRWKDLQRYSRTQGEIDIGGLVGSVTLAGDLAPLLPLLRSAEVVHAGKGATLGLGWVAVQSA